MPDGLREQPVPADVMSTSQQNRMQAGRTRKRAVILVLFAVAVAFYVASFFLVSG